MWFHRAQGPAGSACEDEEGMLTTRRWYLLPYSHKVVRRFKAHSFNSGLRYMLYILVLGPFEWCFTQLPLSSSMSEELCVTRLSSTWHMLVSPEEPATFGKHGNQASEAQHNIHVLLPNGSNVVLFWAVQYNPYEENRS